jgi:hypothetical protein
MFFYRNTLNFNILIYEGAKPESLLKFKNFFVNTQKKCWNFLS